MTAIFLVALREYRQIAATRGFRIMLLGLPLILALATLGGRFLAVPNTAAYIIVDQSGNYASGIEHRLALDYQRQLLGDLSAYAKRWNVDSGESNDTGWSSDAQIEAFVAHGGVNAALRQMAPKLPAGARPFKPSPPPYLLAPPPVGAPVDQGAAKFGAALKPWLQNGIMTADGKRTLAVAVYIPKDFGPAPAQIWTSGPSSNALVQTIDTELSSALRAQALAKTGTSGSAALAIVDLAAPLDVVQPAPGTGRQSMMIRSALPMALVYILLMAGVMTGQLMLQGVIEERSNKLLESVLACIRPDQLMIGKLLGLGAIGMTLVAVWIACAIGAGLAVPGAADVVRPALASLNQPWMIGALLFYFLAGYLSLAMIFLAIGSLSNSTQDAAAYLMPVIWAIMVPIGIMAPVALRDAGSLFPRILSWIPLYTPFAMLARLGSGVTMTEVLGTGLLLIVFLIVEVTLLGRIFRASLLHTGQPPKLAALIRLVQSRS